jgi:hypothetical protein
MNVIFHTTAAIGIIVLFTETDIIDNSLKIRKVFGTSILVFAMGIISHGVLDYIPHCYPINSKLDVILGLIIISMIVWFINKRYWLISLSSFIGSIFPDLVDLLPSILNKQIGFGLSIKNKVFPWHWQEYSGSVYSNNCNVSTMDHILLVLTVCIICWYKRDNVRKLFNKINE